MLDVDPFALIAPIDSDPQVTADKILEVIQAGRSIPTMISLLHPFFLRRKVWPPKLEGPERPWIVQPFRHEAEGRRNFYAQIDLLSDSAGIAARPQVFHFAYSQPRSFGGTLATVRTVFRYGVEATLWHINAHTETLRLKSVEEPTPVETWFGDRAANFLVASVHPFKLSISEEGQDRGALRFPA
ncbi:MAG: hypothetical protein WDN31_00975 [Hyphomicrobium sp.]